MRTYYLRLLGADETRCTIEPGRVMHLGRDASCDLVLPDNFQTAKRHVEVEIRGESILLRSVGVGGTHVNGVKITDPITVHPGDQIQVGPTGILIESEDAPEPEEEPAPVAPAAAPRAPAAPAGRPPSSPVHPERSASSSEARARAESKEPAAQAAPAQDRPTIAGFELLGEIGAGRTGHMYKARSPDGKLVALKVLDAAEGKGTEAGQRFVREVKALERLDHPNIVRVLGTGKEGVHFYCVMEHVPGATLAQRLKKGAFGARVVASIGVQIANALELAHAEGIIHRDVSPAAIVVTDQGLAKLLKFDFVLTDAAASSARNRLTTLGDAVGDVTYSSPEQALDPRNVDARADLYSLGATLYHAAAGRPPHVGRNPLEVVRLVLAGAPQDLGELAPATPRKLRAAIMKLLSRDPKDRFQTAAEVKRALEEAQFESSAFVRTVPEAGAGGGADAAEASGGIAGGFSGAELCEILRFFESQKKTGAMVVSAPKLEATIHFLNGEIIAAKAGAHAGESAVLAVLLIGSGTFRFRPGEAPPGGPGLLRLKPSAVAVEAMRRRDQARARAAPAR